MCIWNVITSGGYQCYLEFRRFSRNNLKVIAAVIMCLFWKESFAGIFTKKIIFEGLLCGTVNL